MFNTKYIKYYNNYYYENTNFIKHLYEYNSPSLKILIAIDDSKYSKSVGGCRFINNTPRDIAIKDVCQLAKAMTKKNIIANIKYGGAKAFIYYSRLKRNNMLKVFSLFLNYLEGIYQTADDINTSVNDMEYMRRFTKYARGYMIDGYQIPATSYGVYLAMKATIKEFLNKDNLKGLKVGIQGLGKVGSNLLRILSKEGCILYVSEIDKNKINELKKEIEFNVVDDLYNKQLDILSFCAIGGVLNYETVNSIKARYIIGGANNQLINEEINNVMYKKNIIYVPDFLVNCGGVIDLDCEGKIYSEEYVYKRLELIEIITKHFIRESKLSNTSILDVVNDYIDKEVNSK